MILKTQDLHLGYEARLIVEHLELSVPTGEIVTLIGPNGSGKSTILKALSRSIKAKRGTVYLNGKDIHSIPPRLLARQLAILPQSPEAPHDITVGDLVWHGRAPHRHFWEPPTTNDHEVVHWALKETKVDHLVDRPVATLSGGERQRAWIALALAQTPEVLLLDEPTTYLDICHQLEVMELVKKLNAELGLTVVMVLHDINQAARYSHRLIALQQGRIVDQGEPTAVLTPKLLREVFKVEAHIDVDATGKPVCLPWGLAANS